MSQIFVFGSNLAGRHGKGAALTARLEHGAIYGQGIGIQGNSYGIPTKDHDLKVLSLNQIYYHISKFVEYMADHPYNHYNITKVGCGLAGYNWDDDIMPMFEDCTAFHGNMWKPLKPTIHFDFI